jgi:hypothetical protein
MCMHQCLRKGGRRAEVLLCLQVCQVELPALTEVGTESYSICALLGSLLSASNRPGELDGGCPPASCILHGMHACRPKFHARQTARRLRNSQGSDQAGRPSRNGRRADCALHILMAGQPCMTHCMQPAIMLHVSAHHITSRRSSLLVHH